MNTAPHASPFAHVEAFSGDNILSLYQDYLKDANPNKVNLGIGIYTDDEGKLPVLQCVQQAEAWRGTQVLPHGYLPMEGSPDYAAAVADLVFGTDSPAVKEGRVATIQTLGGSGGLKVGGDFLKRTFPDAAVYLSDPTWDNHRAMFEGAGFECRTYPYYNAATGGLKFGEMLAAFKAMPSRSIVLLHACCHNPTGVDLSREQWAALIPVIIERGLIPYVDMAYQGFGDGIEPDAFAVRMLVDAGAFFFITNSFSKSFSLYNERCGGLSVVCASADEAARVKGQLCFAVRRNYSSPPAYGGQIVSAILKNPEWRALWVQELGAMCQRMKTMRERFHAVISAEKPGRDFSYFLTQRGMFSYTGLSPEQCDRLRAEHGVYLVRTGRACVAGLTTKNVERVAKAFAAVM